MTGYDMPKQPSIGDLLKNARAAAGLTQEALATRAGVSARVISDLERNVDHAPRASTIELLVAALPLSAQEREQFEIAARGDQREPRQEPARGQTSGPLPLAGRRDERKRLERHVTGDGPPLLVIAGEPGVGKTRLLHEAAAIAATDGLTVLQGTVGAGGAAMRDPVVDAVRRATQRRSAVLLRHELRGCAWLVRVIPELASGPIDPLPSERLPDDQEAELTAAAVVRFLSNIRGPAGVLLTLDNLGLADDASVGLLARLIHSGGDVPLRIVAAYREGDLSQGAGLSPLLGRLAHEQLVTHLTLEPLAPNEAADLFDAAAGGGIPVSLAERVAEHCGGVPFYLVAWAEEMRVSQSEPTLDQLPWAIRQSVRTRVEATTPPARPVLEALAVAGGRATSSLLAALGAQPEETIVACLESAARQHLAQEDGQAYRFAYEVIGTAVEADMGTARRHVLRGRLASLLQRDDHPDTSSERAYHLSVLRRGNRRNLRG